MSAPGFLAVGGVELVNNARTIAYMQRGLGGSVFETVTGAPCPDLMQEAFPLATCPGGYGDMLETDPMTAGRMRDMLGGSTYAGFTYNPIADAFDGAGLNLVNARYLLQPRPAQFTAPSFLWDAWARIEIISDWASGQDSIQVVRYSESATSPGNPGFTGAVGSFDGLGAMLVRNGADYSLQAYIVWGGGLNDNTNLFLQRNIQAGGSTFPLPVPGVYWLRVSTLSQTVLQASLYGNDQTAPPIFQSRVTDMMNDAAVAGLALSGLTPQSVFLSPGYPSIGSASFSGTRTTPLATRGRVLDFQADAVCTPTGELYPSDGLWPADDLYPNLYGEFHDPGTDNAPWVDADRPESYGFLGLLVDSISGLDATSSRSMDPAADGIGGILGPESLDPRDVTVKGWLIADGCSAMEYARRWLGDTLSGHLCSGCDAAYVDVRTTCGDDKAGDFYTNRWRIYDVGLAAIETDTADQSTDCCYVTPVTFKLSAADPYLYGPQLTAVAATLLNGDGQDASPVPFESWLFNAETPVCTTVVDQGLGIDAAIFTFYGGASGIEGGVVYPSLGAYPADGLYPNDCLYPSAGATQWTDGCPFAFTFSIGPGETFVVDNARRRLVWGLADGTQLDGAPRMMLNPGDVIQWIDTCAGASIDACAVAYAACTCDETASVLIQTQHRER